MVFFGRLMIKVFFINFAESKKSVGHLWHTSFFLTRFNTVLTSVNPKRFGLFWLFRMPGGTLCPMAFDPLWRLQFTCKSKNQHLIWELWCLELIWCPDFWAREACSTSKESISNSYLKWNWKFLFSKFWKNRLFWNSPLKSCRFLANSAQFLDSHSRYAQNDCTTFEST